MYLTIQSIYFNEYKSYGFNEKNFNNEKENNYKLANDNLMFCLHNNI